MKRRTQTPSPGERLLTVDETARLLRVSRSTLYRRIDDGTVRPVRIGGRSFVSREEIERVIGGHEQ